MASEWNPGIACWKDRPPTERVAAWPAPAERALVILRDVWIERVADELVAFVDVGAADAGANERDVVFEIAVDEDVALRRWRLPERLPSECAAWVALHATADHRHILSWHESLDFSSVTCGGCDFTGGLEACEYFAFWPFSAPRLPSRIVKFRIAAETR